MKYNRHQTRITAKSIKYYGKKQETARKSIFTAYLFSYSTTNSQIYRDEETTDTNLGALSCLLKDSNTTQNFSFEFTG